MECFTRKLSFVFWKHKSNGDCYYFAEKAKFFTVYYVARVIFYSINLSTLVPEIIEVLADSSTESTTEPNPADAAFQLYLEKYGHYSATM